MKALVNIITLIYLHTLSSLTAQDYTFAVVPQQASSVLAKAWTPILKELEERSGVSLKFATAKNIPTFEERLKSGMYDFAYMNPYHFVVYHQNPGYQALARQKDKKIKGIIVVKKNSPIKTIEELSEMKMAFPSPAAFAASILPRAFFKQSGIKITPRYVSSHDSVYKTVSKGIFVAGGGVVRTFNTVDENTRNGLRILWTTQGYTSHAIASNPNIKEDVRQNLLKAMLEMNEDPESLEKLKALNFKGFETAQNSDWNDVKALNIDLLK